MKISNKHEILYTSREIKFAISEVATKINKDYETWSSDGGQNSFIILCILKGGVRFCMDLLNYIPGNIRLEFMNINAYKRRGELDNTLDMQFINTKNQFMSDIIKGEKVLVVDDIYDSGTTIDYVTKILQKFGAADIKSCVLLDKPFKRNPNRIGPDYVGIEMKEDAWVYGYGLDFEEYHRNHSDICKIII